MKKNQKIIILIFLIVILVVAFVVKEQFANSSEADSDNVEVTKNINEKTTPKAEQSHEIK